MSHHDYSEGGSRRYGGENGDVGKLFVGGIERESTEEDVKDYFSSFGAVKQCQLKRDQAGVSRGFAFVTFQDPATIDIILAEKRHILHNKQIDPKRATDRVDKNGPKTNTKVFVGGFDPKLTEEEIREYFDQFGEIQRVDRPLDRQTNQGRGFCFITFASSDSVAAACANSKHPLGEKMADVRPAEEKQPQSRNYGGGASRGGPVSGPGSYDRNAYGGGNWNAPGGYPPQAYSYPGAYYGHPGPQQAQTAYPTYDQSSQATYPNYGQQAQTAYAGYGQQDQMAYANYYGQQPQMTYPPSAASSYDSAAYSHYPTSSDASSDQRQQPVADHSNGGGPIRHGEANAKNRSGPY